MDTLASLALATEPPSIELLDRKPHNRNEYMISKKMIKHILGQSMLQICIIMIIVFAGEKFLPGKQPSPNAHATSPRKNSLSASAVGSAERPSTLAGWLAGLMAGLVDDWLDGWPASRSGPL